jgi:hypothetical protein
MVRLTAAHLVLRPAHAGEGRLAPSDLQANSFLEKMKEVAIVVGAPYRGNGGDGPG